MSVLTPDYLPMGPFPTDAPLVCPPPPIFLHVRVCMGTARAGWQVFVVRHRTEDRRNGGRKKGDGGAGGFQQALQSQAASSDEGFWFFYLALTRLWAGSKEGGRVEEYKSVFRPHGGWFIVLR